MFTSDCGSGYTAVVSLCFQVDVTDMHYDGTRKIWTRSCGSIHELFIGIIGSGTGNEVT